MTKNGILSTKSRRRIIRTFFTTAIFATSLAAQTTVDTGTQLGLSITISLLVTAVVALLYIFIVLDGNLEGIVAGMLKIRNYVIPPATEKAIDLGHDFDGIRELDNRIPPWFNYLFLSTIFFGTVYMLNYHVFNVSKLSIAEYADEIAAADIQKKILLATEGTLDETKLIALKDPASLKNGGEIFKKYCVSCHGNNGEGVIGPNLTDQYWIHGGGIKNVYTTIKTGVPAKGMISWQLVFSQKQIQEIASYVLSLQGTNPTGGKKPEGTLYQEPDTLQAVVQKHGTAK